MIFRMASVTLLVLLSTLALTSSKDVRRCFVCIPRAKKNDSEVLSLMNVFGGVDSIRKCEDFQESERESFIKECPEDSMGCLTQFQGQTFFRSCARVGVDICKEANNVTYCYCKSNECNTPEQRLADPPSYVGSSFDENELFDDEDASFEASGESGSAPLDDYDEDDQEGGVTEFPGEIIPHIELDGRIHQEEVLQDPIDISIEEKSDINVIISEDYVFEEEEEEVEIKVNSNVESANKKPASDSSLMRSSPYILLMSLASLFLKG